MTVQVHDIDNADNANITLGPILTHFQAYALAEYPLVSRHPIFKELKRSLPDFFQHIINEAVSSGRIYAKDNRLLSDLSGWIGVLTDSKLRAFRHTSTLISLAITTELCTAMSDKSTERSNIENDLTDLEQTPSTSVRSKNNVMKLLRNKKAELDKTNDEYSFLKNWIEAFEYISFMNRYRDKLDRIRALCLRELGIWMQSLPAEYANTTYARYLGWMMSDLSTLVRQEVLSTLKLPYKRQEELGLRFMTSFTESNGKRLIEIAHYDVDIQCRVLAIELFAFIDLDDIEDEKFLNAIVLLTMDAEQRVRKAAAKVLSSYVWNKVQQILEIKAESNSLLKEAAKKHKCWIAYRILAQTFERAIENIAQFYPSEEQFSQNDASPDPLDNVSSLYDIPDTKYSRLSFAGMAIWSSDHVRWGDWRILADFLLYDYTNQDDDEIYEAEDGDDQARSGTVEEVKLLKKIHDDVYANRLDDSLRAILLDLSIGICEASMDPPIRDRARGKTAQIKKEAKSKVQKQLPQLFSELFNRYSHSVETVNLVLRLHTLMDLNIYRETRKESDYDDVLDKIINIYRNATHRSVFLECCKVFTASLAHESFRDSLSVKLKNLLDDLASSLFSWLVNKPETSEVPSAVYQIECLSNIVDIHEVMEGKDDGGSMNDLLCNLLLDDYYNIKSLRIAVIRLLRNQSIWTLSSYINQVVSTSVEFTMDETGVITSAEIIRKICSTFEKILRSKVEDKAKDDEEDEEDEGEVDNTATSELFDIRSIAGSALLDVMVSSKITAPQLVPDDILESFPPPKLDNAIQLEIMALFLGKEYLYAAEAHSSSIAKIESYEAPGDDAILDSVDRKLPSFAKSEGDRFRLFKLDDELCRFTAKIRVAGLSGVIEQEYIERLSRNKTKLSRLFIRIMSPFVDLKKKKASRQTEGAIINRVENEESEEDEVENADDREGHEDGE